MAVLGGGCCLVETRLEKNGGEECEILRYDLTSVLELVGGRESLGYSLVS